MKRNVWTFIALAAVVALVAAACDSDDSSSSDDESTEQSDNGDGGDPSWLADAKAATETHVVTPQVINVADLGPVTPPDSLSVYFIGCDQSIPGCVAQVEGFQQAMGALDFDVEVCDAALEVAAFQDCMNIAVEAGPDYIVNNARPQSDAPEAYAAAHDAGIPVIGQFTSEEPNPETGNAAEVGFVCETEGEILGDYIVAESNGEANVAMFADTVFLCNGQRADGVKKALDRCESCTIEIQQFSAGTAQTDLPPLVQSAIQSNSDLNWIVGTPGFAALLASDAVRQAGQEGSIAVGGFDGDPANLDLIREGDIIIGDALSGVYENGWTVMDVILRLEAGQEIPNLIENPTQILYTPDNVPAEGTYEGAENFEEQFLDLWGVQ